MILKVSLGFARLSDTELDNFTQAVIDQMTGNAAFPTPPVTLPNLQAAKADFTAKNRRRTNGRASRHRRQEQCETGLARASQASGRLCANYLQQ